MENSVNGDVCDIAADASVRPSGAGAREVRDSLKNYFYEEDAVDFQWKMTE